MNAEQLRRYVGRQVVDETGRRLGRVVGITHHGNGSASALVSGGRWPWSDGLQVPLDGAVLIDDRVHLGRPQPVRPTLPSHH